jgi:hypothetical protein
MAITVNSAFKNQLIMYRLLILFALAGLSCFPGEAQQLRTPAPSPPQLIKQDFGLSSIELSYSRPGIKGRNIFGDLVPYGKVWRTGANQATTLTFGDDVEIGGTKIPAGKYGLLTIPGAQEWTIIITRQLDVTTPAAYKQDQDVVRLTAPVRNLPFAIESFTLLFADLNPGSCNLGMMWDKTYLSFPIKTDVDSKVMAQINNTMDKDNHPYFNAAYYYLENGKDLNKALEWFDKALQQDPTAFYAAYQKARCQAKLGKKQEAIATAKKSIELSQQAKNSDYVTLNEKLIASLK